MTSVSGNNVALVVKCLTCKSTYDVVAYDVQSEGIHDPDTGDFVHYEVRFLYEDGGPIYLQDLLCLPKHCSVFGSTSTTMFAFPFLAPLTRSDKWVSSPDRTGAHMAIRRADA